MPQAQDTREYFVLVHGHICGISCRGTGECPSTKSFLTHISEIEEDSPIPLFERQENEGLQNSHVLHTRVRALFERPKFEGQPTLSQDCIGELIRVVTRAAWEARAGRETAITATSPS